jgi:ferredoxin
MSQRVDPTLVLEIEKFGKGTWNECFHCGNCTAVCPLTEQGFLFPRKGYRALQMGLKDTITSSVEPWLCYYCGDCSSTCPRDANPGETMMILRRYLTSVYDWTGLSKKFYTSHFWEFFAIIFIGIITIFLLLFANTAGIITTLTADGGVMLDKMFPHDLIEKGDWTMAVIVAGLLITNIVRMWWKTVVKDKTVKVKFFSYFTEAWNLVVHFATQVKFNKCEGKNYWLWHWLLMSGYVLMFTMIVVYLPWFQTDKIYHWYEPQRILGYYATFGLMFGLVAVFIGRFKKNNEKFKFSHITDWLFIIMLVLTTITGILVHIFRINGMVAATYYSYIIHLAILVPMIMIEVPFSKWSHLAYRPFAVYFAALKKASKK